MTSELRVDAIKNIDDQSAFTFNANGVVTQGNPVACRLYWTHSGGSNNTNNCSMTFIENAGGFTRQSSNSQLVVPVSGWYIVMAGMIPNGATNDFDYRVLKNTTSTSPFLFDMRQSDASSGTHQNSAGSVATHINANEYIAIMSLDDGDAAYTGPSANNPHNWLSLVKVA
jgi:hypothetical protein